MTKEKLVYVPGHNEMERYNVCDLCGKEDAHDFDADLRVLESEGSYGDTDSWAHMDICRDCMRSKIIPFLLRNFRKLRLYDAISEPDGYDYEEIMKR